MATGTLYSTEQAGIQRADALMIGVSAAMVPAALSLLTSLSVVVGPAKWLLNAAIILNVPALVTMIWHSVRWPVRLKLMQERNRDACAALGDDLGHILESVGVPAVDADLMGTTGENVVKGPDGKEYLRMTRKEADRRIVGALSRSLSPDNPIVANTITAHANMIAEAQRGALTGTLDERLGTLKRGVDTFCRHKRYWWFLGMVLCATGSVLYLLNR